MTDRLPDTPIGPHTIQRFTLSNGIKLIVHENHVSPSVVVRGHLWAGAIKDPLEKMGLAHFTAAAVRRGTATRTYQEINELTESVGANTRVRWTFHPLGDLFVVYNHNISEWSNQWQLESNQLLVKLQYSLRM